MEEETLMRGSPVLSRSSIEEKTSPLSSVKIVKRRSESLCWKMTKMFGVAYLAIMGSEESLKKGGVTDQEKPTIDGMSKTWNFLPVAAASEIRKKHVFQVSEMERTRSVSLHRERHNKFRTKKDSQLGLSFEDDDTHLLPRFIRDEDKKPQTAIIFEGGGAKGVISARIVQNIIEDMSKTKLAYEYFDIFAGTSTGALGALANVVPCHFELDDSGNRILLEESKLSHDVSILRKSPDDIVKGLLKDGEGRVVRGCKLKGAHKHMKLNQVLILLL